MNGAAQLRRAMSLLANSSISIDTANEILEVLSSSYKELVKIKADHALIQALLNKKNVQIASAVDILQGLDHPAAQIAICELIRLNAP